MKKLLLLACLLGSHSASYAWEVDVCGVIGLSQPYEFGRWDFSINGSSMGMKGGLQRCHTESQIRTFALEICEDYGGIIDGESISGANLVGEALSQACFQWAKKTDFTAFFTCDEGEENCDSPSPVKVILKGWN